MSTMSERTGTPDFASDPAADGAFAGLVEGWTDGALGLDKHEGIGLLWKEGLFSEFLVTVFRRAPRTLEALARRPGGDAAFDGALPAFVAAMASPPNEREARLAPLGLRAPGPHRDLYAAFAELDPPMKRRFRNAIEAWIDRAAGIEERSRRSTTPSP